ncbi:MAG: hypothetical protein MI922_24970 [Bacteroidales bacterium]|nr:hypothetical protein [Bacteroidales bacterium]
MTAERFWIGWLKTVVCITSAMGVLFLIMSQSSILCKISDSFQLSELVEESSLCQGYDKLAAWMLTSTGILMVNWGILMIYMIWYRVPKGDMQAINTLIIAMLVWFVLDSGFAIYFGVPYITLNNIFALTVYAAPLLSLKNIYKQKPKKVDTGFGI